jgi:8-oxo-dGTP pyrophosphatase MutT (NUDIX family)
MMPAARRARTVYQISAGGVIYRLVDDLTMVCLIRTPPQGQWRLPKGLVEEKESLEDTAVREVQEETGLEGSSEGLIGTTEYWFWLQENTGRTRYHKLVYFYLIKYTGGHTDNHDHEVEEARWFPWDKAMQQLSFASEKKIVENALKMIKSGENA